MAAGCRVDIGCHNQQALVWMTYGPEDSSAPLQAGSGGNSVAGRVVIILVVIQITKRIQLVTIYKMQQLRACAFTCQSVRAGLKP